MNIDIHAGAVLIGQPSLLVMLSISRSGLAKLRKRDPFFPKPIKDGGSRQASVYYVLAEVNAYIASRMAARDTGREVS